MSKCALLKFPDETNAEKRPHRILHISDHPDNDFLYACIEYLSVYEYEATWRYKKSAPEETPKSVEQYRTEGWRVDQVAPNADGDFSWLMCRELPDSATADNGNTKISLWSGKALLIGEK